MTNLSTDPQEMLRLLRESYIARLPDKIGQIEAAWQALNHDWNNETAQTMLMGVHKLSGSGASYGFQQISETARALEIFMSELIENSLLPSKAQKNKISRLLTSLKEAGLSCEPSKQESKV